jgi:hypothetical protein
MMEEQWHDKQMYCIVMTALDSTFNAYDNIPFIEIR